MKRVQFWLVENVQISIDANTVYQLGNLHGPCNGRMTLCPETVPVLPSHARQQLAGLLNMP